MNVLRNILFPYWFLALLIVPFQTVSAQSLPKVIRGYRVYEIRIAVSNGSDPAVRSAKYDAAVKLGSPAVAYVSLTGVTLGVTAEISSVGQQGRVDFLTFRDFTVNGIPVDIDEYREQFSFQTNTPVKLPKPVSIRIGGRGMAQAVYNELIGSKDKWAVAGTILVFGKFRRMGFDFKRVVPVRVSLDMPNPLQRLYK
jgi:hypothetical protein